MYIGKKIIKIRKDNKMTQEDFAEKYNVTRQTISSWENSKSYPDLETIIKISDDFNISLDVLLKEDKKVVENITRSQRDVKKYKYILRIIEVIIGIFIIINLIWFIGIKERYINLTKNFDNSKNELRNYVKDIDGYRYIVKEPGYLGNSGFVNVSVSKDIEVQIDENGNETLNDFTKVTLYIWPEWFSGYTYGIDIDDYINDYQINVTENGDYILSGNEKEDKFKKDLLEDNREEIDKLFDLANNMWNLKK